MIGMRLSEAAAVISAVLHGADARFDGVSTDTRSLARREIFFALKGERFDGHDCLAEAQRRGAAGAVVSRGPDAPLPHLVVADTRGALAALAKYWRGRHAGVPVVAITGSNGKTTVKEMIAAMLRVEAPVLATQGNLNNDIGVPQTLFRLGPRHRYAVIEMGANHAGEIAALAAMARPTVAVVTGCAPAHLQGFGSIAGVARAKAEIYAGLDPDGIAVINADDDFAPLWRETAGTRAVVEFGIEARAPVRATDVAVGGAGTGACFTLHTPAGAVAVRLQMDGIHNVRNALAAAACACALGVSTATIRSGLAQVSPVAGRLQLRTGLGGARIIDDSYNANPGSLHAALAVLRASGGRTWLVLGDMGELGEAGREFHAAAGRAARDAGVERMFAIGDLSRAAAVAFGAGARHYDDRDRLIAELREGLDASVTLLVKGSRSMRLEQISRALAAEAEAPC